MKLSALSLSFIIYRQQGKVTKSYTKKKSVGRNGLSKNNRFSAEEEKKYIPRTEKRKKVPVCETLEFSGFLSSSMLLIISWKLKIIAYRGSSMVPTSSKLELLCQYEIICNFTKSSIIDDLGVRDPPLVCLFSMQNITKKVKT